MSPEHEDGGQNHEAEHPDPTAIIAELHGIAEQWQEDTAERRNEPELRRREVAVMERLDAALRAQAFSDTDIAQLISALEDFHEWIDTVRVIHRVEKLLVELRQR